MIVVDTNVIVRGLLSRNGASFVILTQMLSGHLKFAASPAVILEYEEVLKRPNVAQELTVIGKDDVDAILDMICARAVKVEPWFRFRPFLDDPKDDLFIECALAGGARVIVTGDRHFRHPAVLAFGLTAIDAGKFAGSDHKWTS